MKQYKKWIAALLTGILVVTGTVSPALAAELPTEKSSDVVKLPTSEVRDALALSEQETSEISERIAEAEELVSAAAFSDVKATDLASLPDALEYEEHEATADIPADTAVASADDAEIPTTDDAEIPTADADPTTDVDSPNDPAAPAADAPDIMPEDDAAIPTAPGTTLEQPDEAYPVSAAPAFPVKSMTLSNDTFLYFASADPSFRRSFWDENDDYINDSVQLVLRTTLAAQSFDDVWIVFTETNPTGDYAHTINFVLEDQQKDKNGLWTLTLRLFDYDDEIKSSGNYRLTSVNVEYDGNDYEYKTNTELAPFRNCLTTIYVKTLQELLDSLPAGTVASFSYLKNYDGGSITIPEGITVGAGTISKCAAPIYVNGTIYGDFGTDGLMQLVFGSGGKVRLYNDLTQQLPESTDVSVFLRRLEPDDKSKKIRFYPFGKDNVCYFWNGTGWQNEDGLPADAEVTPITTKISIPKDSKEHWYSYKAAKSGDYAFRLSFTSYVYETFVLETYLMDNLGNMTKLCELYEDSYGDYFIDGVHLAGGSTIYIKAKNSGCTGATLKVESYQAADDWIATVLDFKNANVSVTYSKDHSFVTAEIPILSMDKWKTIDSFDLRFTEEDYAVVSFDKQEVKDGKLILSQNAGMIVSAVIPSTKKYDEGRIDYWFEGPTVDDEGELHEVKFEVPGTNYVIPGKGQVRTADNFTVSLTTRKYVAGTLTADKDKTQPANTSYFYKVVIAPVYESGDGWQIEIPKDYCFYTSENNAYIRLYTDTNKEVSSSDRCYELRGGTYYLQVANQSEKQTSVGYLLNDSVPAVSEVKLGLTTFASQQAVPLTVTYTNAYKLAEVELDLENANGDELELKQYKVTSDNGKTFKSIVYLDEEGDVTGKNFKIIRVGLRDVYGKTTWISAENVSATWTTRNHQLVTRANRFKNSATTEQPVNFIELEESINIPLFAVVNVYEGVNLYAPNTLKVYGTLNTPILSLWGWDDPIEITVDGTINAGGVDLQNFILKGENKGHIVITGDTNSDIFENILAARSEPTQEEVDSYIKMLRQMLTAKNEGEGLLVAVVWSYYKWKNGAWVYDFAALEGLTTSCGMQFEDQTFAYDGKYHSLEVKNKSDAVRVTYENNNHKEPGTYVVTAHFRAPKGYDQESFYDLTATMTIVKSEKFTLSEADGVNIPTLSTLQLKAKTASGGAYPSASSLVWSSSNKAVATVSSSGLVTGKTYGTATITAKTPDGTISASRKVKVVFNDATRDNITAIEFTSICWLADRKISNGYGGVTYGPTKNCTRQEFTIFMYRAAGAPTVTNDMLSAVKFPDIQNCAAISKKAIAWAVNEGIIKGFSDGTFKPDDNITRDSMAIMFYRAAGSPTVTQQQLSAVTFQDISGCTANTKKAIAWAVSAGVVKGFSSIKYGPQENSTRSQVAIMLYRFYK